MKAALSERLEQDGQGAAGPRRAKTTGLEHRLPASLLPPATLAIPAGIFHPFKTGTMKTHRLPVCHGARVFFHSEAKFSLKQQCWRQGLRERGEGSGWQATRRQFLLSFGVKGRLLARIFISQSPYSCSHCFLFTPPRTHCLCILDNTGSAFVHSLNKAQTERSKRPATVLGPGDTGYTRYEETPVGKGGMKGKASLSGQPVETQMKGRNEPWDTRGEHSPSTYKGPEAGACSVCLGNSKETMVAKQSKQVSGRPRQGDPGGGLHGLWPKGTQEPDRAD